MTDIERLAVFDDRIVQNRPRYAVEKGAVSLTNAPFNAISQNASQQSFQVQVPSENVFVDRAIDWTSTCYLQFTATPAVITANSAVINYGIDFALSQFPLHTLVQTLTSTINDTTVTMNTSDVLREVLRLTDSQKNRLQRTCPTYPDTYLDYNDAFGTVNNPLGNYSVTATPSEVKNGAYYNVAFTKPDGSALKQVGNDSYVVGALTVNTKNGVPVADGTATAYPIFFSFTSTEKLVLSPFVFSDTHEGDTGLFGIQNMQFIMNLSAPSLDGANGRVIRNQVKNGNKSVISNLAYNATSTAGAFSGSILNVQFLTPSLDLPLPPRSIVPYMEFPRYVSNFKTTISSLGSLSGQQSQTITLPSIPDLLIIYAKPNSYNAGNADYYLPITQLSVNFDNYSGLLSSHTPFQLYTMSVNNGLVMDWNEWNGKAISTPPYDTTKTVQNVPLVGGPLVLKPSRDITLQTGQAPSLKNF
jgi:hypothetical protein